ncbi:hypothetical protein [Bacillus sp. T33-2]|uniref:hypothetical protein n=1 Tax=Bacillus sp. T33-2 TaxID=2054168 RepID=UPI000C793D41|nr:hypothetical protein [Bacillus sp. T33-2]PLR97841.1 hypothetical protein CVD19_06800 [Bacillus sp. T33-2]
MNNQKLKAAVQRAAGQALYQKGFVSVVDVLIIMNKLDKKNHERWRSGQIPYLERVIEMNLNTISLAVKEIHALCLKMGLKPSYTANYKWGKGPRRKLQFSKSGSPNIEQAYATHYVSKSLSKKIKGSGESDDRTE